MTYLLDTNVLSELRKPARVANSGVREWAASRRPAELFISVITVLEIETGVARLERRDRIQGHKIREWLEGDVLPSFAGRILPVDLGIARRTAYLHVPSPSPERDALIASTAAEMGMSVVTRNVADFERSGVAVINPWGDG